MQPAFCSSCQSPLDNIFYCSNCTNFQELRPPYNFFYLLGLACTFDLSAAGIDASYEEQLVIIHPDLFSNDPKKQDIALHYSALLQEAKECLSDPYQRAQHLLNICGLAKEAAALKPDQEFLIHILDLQESIAANPNNPDLVQQAESEFAAINKKLSALFEQLNAQKLSKDGQKQLFDNLSRYRYYHNIKQQLKQSAVKNDEQSRSNNL